jgi:hypothetical protein
MKCCSSSTTELSHSLQSLSFKCTCGLEYRPVSIANGNAPVLKSAFVRLTERGMLVNLLSSSLKLKFKTRSLLNFFNFFNYILTIFNVIYYIYFFVILSFNLIFEVFICIYSVSSVYKGWILIFVL